MAENVLFLSPEYSDDATVTAASAVASLPAANVQEQEPTKVWRSGGLASQYLVFDLGSSVTRAINAAGIGAHNLTSAATIRVRGATSIPNLTAAPGTDSTAIGAWPSSGKHSDRNWPHELSLVRWTNNTAYRYWRIDFTDAANPDGYFDVGRVMLNRSFQPSLNLDIENSLGFVQLGSQEPNGWGQIFTDPKPWAQRLWNLQFSAADFDEVHDSFMELSRLRGIAGDLMVFLDPAETTRFHRWSMQALFNSVAQFRSQPLFNNSKQMWGFTFPLIEKL